MFAALSTQPWRKLINTGYLLGLSGIVFFLPLKVHFAHIAVGVALFFWLLGFNKGRLLFCRQMKWPLLLFTSLYLVQIFGMLYTDNLSEGFFMLEKKLALLIMPLLLLVSTLDEKEIDQILVAFIAGVLVACIFLFAKNINLMLTEGVPLTAFAHDIRFQNQLFSQYIPIHPAYLSSCVTLSIVILLRKFRAMSLPLRLLSVIMILFFFITILVLMARGTLFAIGAIILILLLSKTVKTGRIYYLVGGSILLASTLYLVFSFVPNIKARVMDPFSGFEEKVKNDDEYTSIALHYKSWYCAVESTLNAHIFLGHGTGDERDILVDCYSGNGWLQMASVGYDSHNEYLSSFVRHGLLGLILFIACLFYSAYISMRESNFLYLSFVVLVAVSAFSESILRGQVPIVIYAFFNACFFRLVWLKRIARRNDGEVDVNPVKE